MFFDVRTRATRVSILGMTCTANHELETTCDTCFLFPLLSDLDRQAAAFVRPKLHSVLDCAFYKRAI